MNKFKLTSVEREVLTAFVQCGMRTSKVSKHLHMCITSVNFHLTKIWEKTGIDPRDFFGLVALTNARCIYQDKACFIIYDGGNERLVIKDNEI